MTTALLSITPVFPWAAPEESALGHHHLIAAYCFTWGVQLAYLAYIALKWRALRKASRQPSSE
jgi:hypothetical protein